MKKAFKYFHKIIISLIIQNGQPSFPSFCIFLQRLNKKAYIWFEPIFMLLLYFIQRFLVVSYNKFLQIGVSFNSHNNSSILFFFGYRSFYKIIISRILIIIKWINIFILFFFGFNHFNKI